MADEGLTEDAEGRLMDKDGVEHIPSDVRRNPWFRAALWAGLAWCLFSLGALIAPGVRGDWGFFWGAVFDNVIAWVALLCAWAGVVFKS
jgi:hypothetical protein